MKDREQRARLEQKGSRHPLVRTTISVNLIFVSVLHEFDQSKVLAMVLMKLLRASKGKIVMIASSPSWMSNNELLQFKKLVHAGLRKKHHDRADALNIWEGITRSLNGAPSRSPLWSAHEEQTHCSLGNPQTTGVKPRCIASSWDRTPDLPKKAKVDTHLIWKVICVSKFTSPNRPYSRNPYIQHFQVSTLPAKPPPPTITPPTPLSSSPSSNPFPQSPSPLLQSTHLHRCYNRRTSTVAPFTRKH
ncbi:hypothetical protein LXL04_018385 [Taraxacum kok-saghyz]